MRLSNALVLNSDDLRDSSKGKKAYEITSNDLTTPIQLIAISEVVMFIDEYSNTRILKNRWGLTGLVKEWQ